MSYRSLADCLAAITAILEDSRLSLASKGLLLYLHTVDEQTQLNDERIKALLSPGADDLEALATELVTAGYLRFSSQPVWHVFDTPQISEEIANAAGEA